MIMIEIEILKYYYYMEKLQIYRKKKYFIEIKKIKKKEKKKLFFNLFVLQYDLIKNL